MSNKKLFFEDDKLKTILKQSPSNKKKSRKTSKALNRSFIEKQIVNSELNFNETELRISKVELERCSTPNLYNICEHCEHDHAKECCMYVHDKHEDIMEYSSFKQTIDENYSTMTSEEDFELKIGSTTPPGFPAYTENICERRVNIRQPLVFYLNHYLWPLMMPTFLPPQHLNFHQNANYLNYVPPVIHTNYPMPPFMPCVVNQAPLPMPYYPNYQKPIPQFVETHNYVPVNYLPPPRTRNWM